MMNRRIHKVVGLMGLVAVSALGVSALRDSPDRLATIATASAFGLNLAAMLVVVAGQGRDRAIAAGYVVAGLSYIFLVTYVAAIDSFVFSHSIVPSFLLVGRIVDGLSSGPAYQLSPHITFVHSSFATAAGLAGGMLARGLAAGRVGSMTTNTGPNS